MATSPASRLQSDTASTPASAVHMAAPKNSSNVSTCIAPRSWATSSRSERARSAWRAAVDGAFGGPSSCRIRFPMRMSSERNLPPAALRATVMAMAIVANVARTSKGLHPLATQTVAPKSDAPSPPLPRSGVRLSSRRRRAERPREGPT